MSDELACFDCHLNKTSLKDSASASSSVYIKVVIHRPLPAFPPMEFIQKFVGRFSKALFCGSRLISTHLFDTKCKTSFRSSLSIIGLSNLQVDFKIAKILMN